MEMQIKAPNPPSRGPGGAGSRGLGLSAAPEITASGLALALPSNGNPGFSTANQDFANTSRSHSRRGKFFCFFNLLGFEEPPNMAEVQNGKGNEFHGSNLQPAKENVIKDFRKAYLNVSLNSFC